MVLATPIRHNIAEMHHSTIQGTLLNAGLDRDVFGDIVTDGRTWQFFVAAHMEDWVMSNITKIGRVGVHFTDYPLAAAVTPENDWESISFSVSALRLDAIVAHGFNMSRQRAKMLIQLAERQSSPVQKSAVAVQHADTRRNVPTSYHHVH